MLLVYDIECAVLAGDIESVRNNRQYLLDTAEFLLTQDITSNHEYIRELKAIINIFNTIYSNSPIEDVLVDDGMYDMLVTKLLTSTGETVPGAPLVDFKDTTAAYSEDSAAPCVSFFDKELRNDAIEFYRDQFLNRVDSTGALYGTSYPRTSDIGFSPVLFSGDIARRTRSVKHDDNTLVGTLDKCKFVLDKDAIAAGVDPYDGKTKTLEKDFFAKHIMDGIITPDQDIQVVISLKYDGTSIEAECSDVVERALSRGDTGVGLASDMTPVLKGYPFPRHADGDSSLVDTVKFEAIMTYEALHKYNIARGKKYSNCRSAINGLFTASDAWKYRDYITLVPLEMSPCRVTRETAEDLYPGYRRLGEIVLQNALYSSHGVPFIHVVETGNYKTILFKVKKFLEEAEYARSYMGFMYDGIVVEYADDETRAKLGRKDFVSQYSMAVKFNPLKKQTIFRGYEFTVGKNGEITPMIYYDPVEFMGTIHPKSSGHSYARFVELGLKPGDIIDVTYRNDVMPYVERPDNAHNMNNPNPVVEFPTECPVCGTKIEISSTGKSAVCPNPECPGRQLARNVGMLYALGFQGFAEASVTAMGGLNLQGMMTAPDWVLNLGEADTKKFMVQREAIMANPMPESKLLGALGFTGMAMDKWRLITTHYTIREIDAIVEADAMEELYGISGIGERTVYVIMFEWPNHRNDIMWAIENMNITPEKGMGDKLLTIRYSGFRDLQLSQQLCSMGYDARDSSVNKNTDILLVPSEGYSSSKTNKVGPNTRIIPVAKFVENMDYYLNGGD